MNDNKIIVVCGATASGKTALAVELALMFGGEVIGADSMQIYTDMDIASAKPTEEEKRGVPHHLIGFLPPSQSFSVADYVKLCDRAARDILSRGKTPVICGGTGLYISSFVDNITFDESEGDPAFRAEMRRFAEENGAAALYEKLRQCDPETAATLHENNIGRVIRALEVYKQSGRTIAEAKRLSRKSPSPYRFAMVMPHFADRKRLHERINRRVDNMLAAGLVEEARRCFADGARPTAAQAIGVKELYPYLRGEKTLHECAEEIKLRTRQYAKRQLTWFRRDGRVVPIPVEEGDGAYDVARKAAVSVSAQFEGEIPL